VRHDRELDRRRSDAFELFDPVLGQRVDPGEPVLRLPDTVVEGQMRLELHAPNDRRDDSSVQLRDDRHGICRMSRVNGELIVTVQSHDGFAVTGFVGAEDHFHRLQPFWAPW